MNIIGFYKDYNLIEQNNNYLVVNRRDKKVLFKGEEEEASKMFIMLSAKFIDENLKKIEV